MLNSLDLLIIVFLALAVIALLALCLLWLVKKPPVRRICLMALAGVGLYLAAMGAYIGAVAGFPVQLIAAIALGAAAIAAVVLELRGKTNKTALIARSLMSASVVLGMVNAFC